MLAAGGGEDGAGAPSGWRRAREGERERRLGFGKSLGSLREAGNN
jgi:hypothetical protein